MMVAGRMLRRPREEIDAIFDEIEGRLQEEIDYTLEAQNLEDFRRRFVDDPDVVIPRSYPGWSTRSVLTMERLPGRPIGVFAATASPEAKQRAGVTLGRTFMKMFYKHRAIHADPHPGNYLFQADGRVGILDFGCARRFDLEWVESYGACGWHTRYNRREELLDAARRMGALINHDPDSEEALWQLCLAIGIPFRGGPYTCGVPGDTADQAIAAAMPKVMMASGLRAPHQLVFLHRSLGGTYQLIRQLHARADWGEIFEEAYLTAKRDLARVRAQEQAQG
jgi:predicted unusual protein kinase regulating ubiquinone biosynthesis (AarF/ABC1/UbiB family)